MAGAKLERTRWPGIYRRGDRWVCEWTDANGARRRGTAETCDAARALKREREDQAARGERDGARGRLTVAGYALELFGADVDRAPKVPATRGRYQGRRGAVRVSTIDDYRRDLERYVLPKIGSRQLAKVTAPDLSRIAAALAARSGDEYLADRTIRRIFAPLGAMLATAVEEGLIGHNAARDVRLPSGRDALRRFDAEDQDDPDDPAPGKARALTRAQVAAFLLIVNPKWRLFFELLACTGLRVSEAIALRWGDVILDGNAPVVRVRRGYVRGAYGPPKSRHSRRDVPIPPRIVRALRERRKSSDWGADADLVFPAANGLVIDQANLRRRVLAPAREEAGVTWAGFHAFRHHCASQLIDDGRNIVQVSRWLGHASASFTLDVYAHLLDDGVGAPIDTVGVGLGSGSEVRWSSVQSDESARSAVA